MGESLHNNHGALAHRKATGGGLVFAEMSSEGITALIIALGTLATTIAGGVVLFMQARAKVASDARKERVSEHEKIIERQSKELELQRQQIHEQQDVIDRMHTAHTQAREEAATLYGFIMLFRNGWENATIEVQRLKGICQPVPPLPTRKAITLDTAGSEFLQRTTAQNTELVDKLHKNIKPTPKNDSGDSSPLAPTT